MDWSWTPTLVIGQQKCKNWVWNAQLREGSKQKNFLIILQSWQAVCPERRAVPNHLFRLYCSLWMGQRKAAFISMKRKLSSGIRYRRQPSFGTSLSDQWPPTGASELIFRRHFGSSGFRRTSTTIDNTHPQRRLVSLQIQGRLHWPNLTRATGVYDEQFEDSIRKFFSQGCINSTLGFCVLALQWPPCVQQ